MKYSILLVAFVFVGCSKQPDSKQDQPESGMETPKAKSASKSPQQEATAHLVAAKALLEAGDYDRGIEYLAKSIAVDGATDQEEAKRLLKDAILKRNKDETLDHIAKTMIGRTSSPQAPFVSPKADWTAEQVLRAYLQAPRWDYRLPFVLTPDEVRPLMEERYRGGSPPAEGFSIVGTSEQDGRTIIRVNLPTSPDTPFYLARSKDGFRVDWKECVRQWNIADDAAFRKANKLENASIELKVLKKAQLAQSTTLELRITNSSQAVITHVSIQAEAIDANRKYLAQSSLHRFDKIIPNDSAIVTTIFNDTAQSSVSQFVFRVDDLDVVNELGQKIDAVKYFKVNVVQ